LWQLLLATRDQIRLGASKIRTLGHRISSFVGAGMLGFAAATTYTPFHGDCGPSFGYMCVVRPWHVTTAVWRGQVVVPMSVLATGAWLGPRPQLGYNSGVLFFPLPVSPTTTPKLSSRLLFSISLHPLSLTVLLRHG
jgi:hypothetical protein